MAKTTFWDIIEQTIRKVGTPLSPKEIWDKANELGTIGDFVTTVRHLGLLLVHIVIPTLIERVTHQ